MSSADTRFRFRFSLRVLFVVMALLSCWLGWEWRISNERHKVRTLVESRGGSFYHGDRYRFNLFGDWQEMQVELPSAKFSKDEELEVRRVFPESAIYVPAPR
jgi:hypothetical protein